uniref:Uncharacterized protein n=1 Tax=Arundo donax TaxID=35708 RepID=A0A0A9B812_ARUDO
MDTVAPPLLGLRPHLQERATRTPPVSTTAATPASATEASPQD